VWQSPDPVLGKYLSEDGPAGGLKEPINFGLYTYGRNSPLIYRDPDGRFVFLIPLVIKGIAVGAALYGAYETGHAIGTSVYQVSTGEKTVGEAAKEGAINVGTNAAISAIGLGVLKVIPEKVKQDILKTVGRWMNPDELAKMKKTGKVQEGGGGQTRVSDPADINAYRNAPEGDVYVEFDVPASSVKPHSQGTGRIPGPNSPDARAAAKAGKDTSQFEMPPATNIKE
jgi:hypothetical protein